MKASAFALVPVVALAIATGFWANQMAHPKQNPDTVRAQAPLPIRWMPSWLLEPIEKAIADANSPRDRKPKR